MENEEVQLVRSINGQLRHTEDRRLSVCLKLVKLKDLVKKRGENWTKYRQERLRKSDSTPYARQTIDELLRLGRAADGPAQALEDLREKKAKAEKERRKRHKAKEKRQMPRSVMCAYGSCENWITSKQDRKITVTITERTGERSNMQSFCCEDHAARWLDRWHGVTAMQPGTVFEVK